MTSLRLRKYSEAYAAILKLNKMPEWTSENYLKEQCTFLLAICARLLEQWDVMHEAYS